MSAVGLPAFVRNIVKGFARRRGYRLASMDNLDLLETLLYFLVRRQNRFSFVQIGANDGVRFDPIHRFVTDHHHLATGLVVEPLPDLFRELQANYRTCPHVVPVNVAIHNTERSMTLYRVDPVRARELPDWSNGIASFNPRHHQLVGLPAELMVAEQVPCITLAELFSAHAIADLDLLQIDVEGYDADLIMALDFDRVRPKLIHFEHGLPSGVMSPGTFNEVLDLLHARGYEVIVERDDATAYDRYLLVGDSGSKDRHGPAWRPTPGDPPLR
jgi:FkbM family methyltransferase